LPLVVFAASSIPLMVPAASSNRLPPDTQNHDLLVEVPACERLPDRYESRHLSIVAGSAARGESRSYFGDRLRNPETQAVPGFDFVAAVFRDFVACWNGPSARETS
jgi:hypothetical protein